MSRILKALATIESKGATLTLSLPRDASAQRPRRREGAPPAELSLAALEAYLQAALAAEQTSVFDADASDAVALYCTPGLPGPLLEHASAVAAFTELDEASSEWASRDSGPTSRSAIVDRETPYEPLPEAIVDEPHEAEELNSLGLLLIPADDIVEAANVELLSWSDELWDLVAKLPTAVEPERVIEVVEVVADEPVFVDLASFCFEVADDLSPWTESEELHPAAADSVETIAPSDFPGWPDAVPLEAVSVELPDVDLNAITVDAAAPDHAWLERHDLCPAEPHGQLSVACPDWLTVEAAIQALAERAPVFEEVVVIEVEESLPSRVLEPPPVARRRLSSREMLPAESAWEECRAIADGLLAQWDGAAGAWLFVELGAIALRAPIVAPLAAMLVETIRGRVLLVDTDCRLPHDLQALRDAAPRGFADVLRQPDAWPKLVQCSAVERLDMIPAGQCDAASVPAVEQFAAGEWLKTLNRAYDLVLLHATWPGAAPLAQLAESAAATFLVAPLGAIEQIAAEEAVEHLRRWGAKVQGCILTEE